MTKEEFEARMKQLHSEIRERENELRQLRKQYANENAPFKIGDEIICKGKKGVISEVALLGISTTSFAYRWQPYKKDGTLSYERDLWDKFEKV